MNVCCICMADGVVEVSGQWYCPKHVHHALQAVAEAMVLLSMPKLDWTSSAMEEAIDELLNDAGYIWPDDEDELDVDDGQHDHTS